MSHEEIINAIQKLDKRLDSLESKIDDSSRSRSSPHADASASTSANRSEHFVFSADNNDGALRQRNFEGIRDKRAKISLPSFLKVNDSSTGIKQESRSTLKAISKTYHYAETGLKLLAAISQPNDGGTFTLSDGDMADCYNIFASQIQYLQSEYASLIVKNTFDEETLRLFISFENHSSAFSQQSIANVRVAAELAAATNFRRPNYRRAGLRPSTPFPPHRRRRGSSPHWQRIFHPSRRFFSSAPPFRDAST